ncbi:(2Fe-2S)-binding protein [Rubellimicrobium rubrum]|uniref:(2Fe-2S)-binding protein n=1 Tax=Rubellimicrobium rubrum TaxID=2585369 RepID=A0A5C4MQI5_9RHOB|nr:(2Fe-2S)-binding protein [Rubellimicrobium rubrum]TNC47590.1 (2Fe-2S)-binding protein [Rubellimicrobium rubrum]
MVNFVVNSEQQRFDGDEDTPLLWVLRDELGFTGTKYGCGIAACGACTVHIDGQPSFACITPVGTLEGAEITTIEGLSPTGDHPVQVAWRELNVVQCGYCQAGQIMQAAALVDNSESLSDEDIDAVMSANLCRCGTYPRIRAAIKQAMEAK